MSQSEIRWEAQLLVLRKERGIKLLKGSYNVVIRNKITGDSYETQGDIPNDVDYSWRDFLEWLAQDIREINLGPDNEIDIVGLEYVGENAED